jgi:hypothetical protein
MTVSSVLLHTPTKVRSDRSNIVDEQQQQCRILECYHDTFISSSNFDHNRNHSERTTVSCENMERDRIMEEEDDLLPPTLARLWSYNDDNKVGGMNQGINQVADSLIPEIDDDGISESSSDVLVQEECINDDSYEVQVEDFITPEIYNDGMNESSSSPDLLVDQCINDESYEVTKILLEIQLSSNASDNFEPGVEIAQTPPKKSSVFDCDLSPVSVTTFDIAPTPPTTQSEMFVDSITSTPSSSSTARQEEEATTIRANAIALLERADRVDTRVSSPVQDTTTIQSITSVSVEVNTVESSAVSCSLTANSTISIVDGTTPPTSSMIRPQLCDSQQEMPPTPTEIEESCSVFTSLFGTAGPPSPSPSILVLSTDEDIHIGNTKCVKRTTSKVITPLRRFEVETVESSAVNCSLTADSSISIENATPPTSEIRRQSCDSQQKMMPSNAMDNEESCSVFSFLFGTCSSPPSPSPSILVSSTDEDIGIVDANSESFECVLHEFLNGKRSVTKVVTPPSASPSRETLIIVDTNENLSPIRPPHVGRILDVGANFNPAKQQQADMRNVVVSGGKVRVKNDLSWIKKI